MIDDAHAGGVDEGLLDRRDVASRKRGVERRRRCGRRVGAHAPVRGARRLEATSRRARSARPRVVVALRPLGEQRRALRLPQLDGAALLGVGLAAAAGGAQRRGEGEARVGVVEQRVGGGGDGDRGLRQLDRRGVLAALRQRLGAHAAPGDGRLQVVAGERLALVAQRLGLRRRAPAPAARAPSSAAARAASMPRPRSRRPS